MHIYIAFKFTSVCQVLLSITRSWKLKETATMPATPVGFGSVEQLLKMVLDSVVKSHLRESLLTRWLIQCVLSTFSPISPWRLCCDWLALSYFCCCFSNRALFVSFWLVWPAEFFVCLFCGGFVCMWFVLFRFHMVSITWVVNQLHLEIWILEVAFWCCDCWNFVTFAKVTPTSKQSGSLEVTHVCAEPVMFLIPLLYSNWW